MLDRIARALVMMGIHIKAVGRGRNHALGLSGFQDFAALFDQHPEQTHLASPPDLTAAACFLSTQRADGNPCTVKYGDYGARHLLSTRIVAGGASCVV